MQRAAPEKRNTLQSTCYILDNLTCATIQSIISVSHLIIRSMNDKHGNCCFSAKNLQTDVYNLNVIITSTNKNVPAVYKTRMKHWVFIERKTNTAMKASVINEISHCKLTDSETLSFMFTSKSYAAIGECMRVTFD